MPIEQRAVKDIGEDGCLARIFEVETETTLPVREKGDLEQRRLYRLVVEPGSHLGYRGGQVGVRPMNLNNVHALTRENVPLPAPLPRAQVDGCNELFCRKLRESVQEKLAITGFGRAEPRCPRSPAMPWLGDCPRIHRRPRRGPAHLRGTAAVER
jgi:hypothetical protein